MKNALKKLVVLPNDPLARYHEKGEIKERYFNPCNYFDEVHVISLCQQDIAASEVQTVAGSARLVIHPIGRPSFRSLISFRKIVAEHIKTIAPHCIRAYNPLLMGWYAVYAGQQLGIPSVISLHDDYSIWRRRKTYGKGYWARAAYQVAYRLSCERYTFQHADRIICAYEFVRRYAEQFRKDGIEVIYNRVNLERFRPRNSSQIPAETSPLKIICVGRQFQGKDPTALVKALPHLSATLTLIGQGPLHQKLKELAREIGVASKITFLEKVANAELPDYYRQHDVFAMTMIQPGVCIPMIEAMASGLPIVINEPIWGGQPEVVGELALLVKNTPEGYRQALQQLVDKPALRASLGKQVRERAFQYDGRIMEEKERDVYEQLTTA